MRVFSSEIVRFKVIGISKLIEQLQKWEGVIDVGKDLLIKPNTANSSIDIYKPSVKGDLGVEFVGEILID